MDRYIYGTKKDINIIDLQKTLEKLNEAVEAIKRVRKEGKQILFVGTKKQAKDLVAEAARKCEMPFVTERWLGGTFTNFPVIKGRARYLKESQEKMEKGEFGKYTKFEQSKKAEELNKLEKRMGGIKNMTELPGLVFVVDMKEDLIAIKEANNVNIDVVALADTNVDPSLVRYPIPSNDDAISSIKLMLTHVCKAILE